MSLGGYRGAGISMSMTKSALACACCVQLFTCKLIELYVFSVLFGFFC